jgi:hypothetical protein
MLNGGKMRLSVERFTNPDGTFSHYSVMTLDAEGMPVDVATGVMHDDEMSAYIEKWGCWQFADIAGESNGHH